MTPEAFTALAAQGYNRIPVSTEVLADLETPISAYRKLAEGPYSFLFESVQGGEKWGRYSIIGLPCRVTLSVTGKLVEIREEGELVHAETVDDPLAFVETFQSRYRAAPADDLPVFHGGLVGYFGYDTVRYVEPRLAASVPKDELGTPDILLMLADEVLVMSRLPMKILEQLALSGPKPRRLSDPELIQIKEHVLRRLQEELGNEIP